MDFEILPVNKIKYAPYNPRKISDEVLDKLKRSIEEFGYIEPIIVNKRTMHVVGGNQRLKVLKQMGIKEVQAVVVDLDDTHEKALNLALNKISGEWDLPLLKDLLLEIDSGEIDTEIAGFDMPEIEELMNQFRIEGEEDNFNVDEAVEEIKEPITQRGDIYLLGRHRLMCGDSTIKEDVEKLMDGKKALLALTDPPYNVGIKYKTYDDSKQEDEYIEFCRSFFELLEKYSEKQIITPGRINEWVWYKIKIPFYNAPWIKTNAMTNGKISRFMCSEPVFFYGDKWGKKRSSDVFDFPIGMQGSVGDHPCPKPLKMFIDLIENYSDKNSLILDLFLGSGSTLIACEQTNRICYGMEIDPVYCDVIVKRWQEYTGKKAELLGNQNGSTIKINSGS